MSTVLPMRKRFHQSITLTPAKTLSMIQHPQKKQNILDALISSNPGLPCSLNYTQPLSPTLRAETPSKCKQLCASHCLLSPSSSQPNPSPPPNHPFLSFNLPHFHSCEQPPISKTTLQQLITAPQHRMSMHSLKQFQTCFPILSRKYTHLNGLFHILFRVFPAEACEVVGGEACDAEIYPEVKLKPEAGSRPAGSATEGVDREYLEYDSTKT